MMFYTTIVRRQRRYYLLGLPLLFILLTSIFPLPKGASAHSFSSSYDVPTWWAKYQALLQRDAGSPSVGQALSVGPNVDMSNEDTPQSETSITVNPSNPKILIGGSNEIVRLPMRGYFSSNGGQTWGGVDLPLPPPATTNGTDFGSDPGVAFDTRGNVYYSYIVVFFNRSFTSIQATEMAGATSSDRAETC